jgi:hypothetical protein
MGYFCSLLRVRLTGSCRELRMGREEDDENTLRYLQWFHRRVMDGQLELFPGSKGLSKDPT